MGARFAWGTPLVTIAIDYHSREIEYLEDGVNGVIVRPAADVAACARALAGVSTDESLLGVLLQGGRRAAATYTNDAMVDRFAQGVAAALRLGAEAT